MSFTNFFTDITADVRTARFFANATPETFARLNRVLFTQDATQTFSPNPLAEILAQLSRLTVTPVNLQDFSQTIFAMLRYVNHGPQQAVFRELYVRAGFAGNFDHASVYDVQNEIATLPIRYKNADNHYVFLYQNTYETTDDGFVGVVPTDVVSDDIAANQLLCYRYQKI